jgi:hypothetical protein
MSMSPRDLYQFAVDSYKDADAALGYEPKRVFLPKKYTLTFGVVGTGLIAGGALTLPLVFQANGDFVLARYSFSAALVPATLLTETTQPVPQWRVLITDSGTDEQYSNAPVNLSDFANWTGGGSYFRDEVYPRMITGSSQLSIQMTSYETVTAYTVDFVLHGILVKTFS